MLAGCSLYGRTYVTSEADSMDVYETSFIYTEEIEYLTSYDYGTMSLEDIMNDIMETYGLNEDNFSLFYENTITKETYTYQEDSLMLGASTVKVAVNMMFYDLGYDIDHTYLLYDGSDFEEGGGYTTFLYSPGDYIPLSYLMEQSIVFSDNTAINIMIDELGFTNVRNQLAAYSNTLYPDEFYYENLIDATILHNVISQLYENSEEYGDLVEHMLEAMPGRYIESMLSDVDVAHKYGEYGTYLHDFGIVYAQQPFYLGILTNGVTNAEEVIGYISRVLYEYQSYHLANNI